MRILYFFIITTYAFFITSCSSSQDHDHSAEAKHDHESETVSEDTHEESEHDHNHENVKQQITAYNNEFELFAEADPFVTGEEIKILAHFTYLKNFKPLEKGSVTASIIVNGKTVHQKLDEPTRKGIFSFILKPEDGGTGKLIFDIVDAKGNSQITIDNIKVYTDEHDAIHETEEASITNPNSIVFTKEQSWKVDFETQNIESKAFGQTIKASAKVELAPLDEIIITAKNNGIVYVTSDILLEGMTVKMGQNLMQISGNEFADNNFKVKFTEAQSNFENAKATHIRNTELVKDKIISEKEFQQSAYDFENAKTIYENLRDRFNPNGQTISSPFTGTIRNIWVKNGQGVDAGSPLISVTKNNKLILQAGVQSKYASEIKNIESVNIRQVEQNKVFSQSELNGKLISIGNSASESSYLLPINFQIDKNEWIIPGTFVELFIKTKSQNKYISVPNSALIEEQGYFAVLVQLTPELFEKREVEVGTTDGFNTMIKTGLTEGERIITKGAILVKLAAVSNSLDPHAGHVH